jgi:hypothetical protein
MQCHFDENLAGIPRVLEILDRFEVFGLPIQITEFDVAIRDEDLQARYLEDFYTAVFSHPATDKIVMWGFYEKVMWKPLAALVRSDWSHKPNYDVYMDLLYNQWWTPDFTGAPDAEGALEIRGFNGYYDMSVEMQDSTYVFRDRLIEHDTILVLSSGKADYPVGISPEENKTVSLLMSHPNPFTDQLILSYTLDAPRELSFQFYGMDGALVSSSTVNPSVAGAQTSVFNFSHLPAGIYMCVVDTKLPELDRRILKIVKE